MTRDNEFVAEDQGLYVLTTLLRLYEIGADPEQIRHRFGGVPIGIPEMLRCAREFGLKARERSIRWDRLATTPLPAIAACATVAFSLLLQGRRGQSSGPVALCAAPRTDDAERNSRRPGTAASC